MSIATRMKRHGSLLTRWAALWTCALLLHACSGVSNSVNPQPLMVSTSQVPQAQVGVAYSATLQASGGASPYSWEVVSGALPTGLALNAGSGALSGTPAQASAAAMVTFRVNDSSSPRQTNSVSVPMSVAAATLRLLTSTLPSGSVGQAYSAALSASGGTPGYTYSITAGSLAPGLSLDPETGLISGTPTSASTSAVTITVTDSGGSIGQTTSATLTLSVSGGGAGGTGATSGALSVTTLALAAAQVGKPYSAALSASGGTPPYIWALTSGTLPAGLAFASSGTITGTPTSALGNTLLTFRVTDASSPAGTASITLALSVLANPLTITTTSLPAGNAGTPYAATLAATGGTTPYTWQLTGGVLPAGLTFSNGAISGTPSSSATASALTFKVSDASAPAQSASVTLTLTIAAARISITTATLPGGQVGAAYSATLTATGGTTPYKWQLAGGTLPAGLTFAGGALSGTPTAAVAGTQLTFQVTDSGTPAQSASVTLGLTVTPAKLAITTTALPAGQVGTAYSTTLTATGGTTPYAWSLSGGTLPAGLNFSGGTLSGTPTATAAAVALTFKVSDAGNPAQSSTVTVALTVTAATLSITTSALPNAQVGSPYSTTLAAKGGTTPYTWQLSGGTLPSGLNFSGGVISGTPTASATNVSLTFQVTDAGTPAQSATQTLMLTIAPAKLSILTASLPSGTLGSTYAATLAASGGTTPYTWSLTAGALPAGLGLAPNGIISGTPSAPATATPLTFRVTDAGNPAQTASVTLSLTISSGGAITVSVTPARAAVTIGQPLTISATTNDSAGVAWSISPNSGSFTAANSQSGVNDTLVAPSSAGVYTVTATSVTSPAVSASFIVGVTDLGGVYTYHNDLARDGANLQEYALTPENVNTGTFGKLFSCPADGAVYAQPLWMANVTVNGARHNVVFVATAHDSVFAFDADTSPCQQLWQVSAIDTSHGGTGGEVSVPAGTTGNKVGYGDGDMTPEVGITGTPVIDPTTNILYVVSKSMNAGGTVFYQRLHAIDVTTGNERPGSPVTISGTYPGTGDGGTTTTFNPRTENERCALALVNGVVYITWGAHEDATPYYGWTIGYSYNGSAFSQAAVLNNSPNVHFGGIWMSGGAPAADSNGNLYVVTGNGTFDAANTSGHTNDYGDSFLQLSPSLQVQSYFAPTDQASDAANDADQGAGGAAVVLNLPSGSGVQHLLVGGGKDGTLYVLNGDNMGGYGDGNAYQHFPLGGGLRSTGAFWNNTYYVGGIEGPVTAFAFNTSTLKFNTQAVARAPGAAFLFPGATPSVSASGGGNGIVWALNSHAYCTRQSQSCGPAVLHAYNGTNIGTELWNSSMVAADAAGNAVKFTLPTIANGRVYVGDRGNNTGGLLGSTSVSGQLDVYGLKPH